MTTNIDIYKILLSLRDQVMLLTKRVESLEESLKGGE